MNECAIARVLKSGKPRFRDSPNLGIDKSLNLLLYLTSQKIHEFSGLRNKIYRIDAVILMLFESCLAGFLQIYADKILSISIFQAINA